MKHTRWIACLAAVWICLGATGVASAGHDGPGGFGRGHGPPPIDRILERHAAELGLSEEVRAQVRVLAEASEATEQTLGDALMAERTALRDLLAQDFPDPDAVMRQAELIGAAETELHKQRLRTLLAVRELLTPEQRQGLVRIFEERRQRMGHRWRMHDGEPPPGEARDAPAP